MLLWIELPQSENLANTYAWLSTLLGFISSVYHEISTTGDWTTGGSVVEFWLCNLWLLVQSPVVEIMVYTADKT